MSDPTPKPNRPVAASGPRPLADRLSERVALAHHALEQRDRHAPSRPERRRRRRRAGSDTPRTPRSPEVRALRRVFVELGATYRQYRRRTGKPASVPLRAAATAFRKEPSLTALTSVAGYLDELALLDW